MAKTTGKTPDLVPQPHGGALASGGTPGNRGGKKGRSGRKPDAWRAELQAIVSSDAVLDTLERVLSDSTHPAYVGALKYASDHGFGRPRERVDVTLDGEVTVKQEWTFGKRSVVF